MRGWTAVCSYAGWITYWNDTVATRTAAAPLVDWLKVLLDDHNASFSQYMAHGGTTFGLWSGADADYTQVLIPTLLLVVLSELRSHKQPNAPAATSSPTLPKYLQLTVSL